MTYTQQIATVDLSKADQAMERIAHEDQQARDRAAREMFKALVAIRRMTDGTQPKDYPGALMVVGHAIRVAVDARIALPAEA